MIWTGKKELKLRSKSQNVSGLPAYLASASVHVMNLDKEIYDNNTNEMCSHINVGMGEDLSIGDLAMTLKKVIGFDGAIEFDSSKPDGSPRKLMDSSRLNNLGWSPKYSLEEGLKKTYLDFLAID